MTFIESSWTWIYQELFHGNAFYIDFIGGSVVTFTTFWTLCGLLGYVDLTGRPSWMLKYKTQPGQNEPVDKNKLKNAIRVALFNEIAFSAPCSFVIYKIRYATCGETAYLPEYLPALATVIRDLFIFLVVNEIGFYYTHRLVHWGPLYKTIHKKHHEWTAPIGVVAIYAHPVEYVLSNLTPFVLGPLLMKSHLATTWLWYLFAITTTVVHHSGYHLPFLPSPEFHDFHHLKFNTNYGVAGWLDWLHGTDKLFRNSIQQKRDHITFSIEPLSSKIKSSSQPTEH